MKRHDWLTAVLLPLLTTWGLDRITKIWAIGTTPHIQFHGPLGFVLHRNYGAMLGLFSNIPPLLRIVSLSTGGAFLVFSFIILQYLIPLRSLMLRAGLSILMGGILGNVSDRIIWGYVVDFIVLKTSSLTSPVFNVSDLLQWVGYVMIVASLVKEGNVFWPKDNARKSYWINPRFQLKYCFILIAIGFSLAVIVGTYSYTYFRVTIVDLAGEGRALEAKYLLPYILTFLVVNFAFLCILYFIGLILSHRAAGPLYAFERFLEDLYSGKPRRLKLRSGDEFHHLEELANQLLDKAEKFSSPQREINK